MTLCDHCGREALENVSELRVPRQGEEDLLLLVGQTEDGEFGELKADLCKDCMLPWLEEIILVAREKGKLP